MSHIATIETKMTDLAAINAACRRLRIDESSLGTHELYDGKYAGHAVKLDGWQYPIVIDHQTGEVKYDNYKGQWGKIEQLNAFQQAYAVEKTKIEFRRKGLSCTEKKLADGRVQLVARAT